MALRNLKYYIPAIKHNRNAAVLQQIQFEANASDPSDADLAVGRLHYKTGTGLRWYDGSNWYTIPTSSGGGTLNTWDEMYTLDKTLTIDSTTLTFALTHATNDGLTITGAAGSAGDCIQITNSGSGNDINGTSDTWQVTKAGAATFVGITPGGDITSTATAIDWDLIDNNASALSLDATGKAGIIAIVTTNSAEGVTMSGTLTVAGVLTASTGWASSDGTCTVTDNSNAANGLVFVNDTVTTYGNASDAGPVHFSSATLSTGHLLTLSLDESELAGGSFIRCWHQDAGAAVFSVGEDGATVLAGKAAGTTALTLSLGDLVITDTDASTISSVNGTGTLLTLDNAGGAIADNSAVLTLDAGGTPDAAGSNILRVAFTGTDTNAPTCIEVVGGGKDCSGLYIDCDSATEHTVYINNDGNVAAGKSMLYIDYNGDANATGTLLTLDNAGATATNTPYIMQVMGASVDAGFLTVDCDAATDSVVLINGGGAIANNKAVMEITADGTPANAGSNVLRVAFTGTDTHKPVVFELIGSGKDCQALNIDADPTTTSVVVAHTDAALADDTAVLALDCAGAAKAGSSILRLAHTGTPAAATSYTLEIDNSGATSSSNPVTVYIDHNDSTAAIMKLTTAGAAASSNVDIEATDGGAGGAILSLSAQGGSQATNDYVGTILFIGEDDGAADNEYGAIKCQVNAAAAGSEDGRVEIWASVGGTDTELFAVESTSAGAKDCEIKTATCTLDGSAAGTAAFTITNGDIALSAGGMTTTTTADQYGLDVTVNKATATQGVAVFTNASTTSAKHVLEIEQADVDEPYMKFSGATAITSANAGANGDVPAQVVGYLLVDVDGTDRKVPYYAT